MRTMHGWMGFVAFGLAACSSEIAPGGTTTTNRLEATDSCGSQTPPPTPSTPTTPSAPGSASMQWAQTIIDDMTLASDETEVAAGDGSTTAPASMATIGMTGGNYDSIVGICSGICDHFASTVSGATSWTWIWAGKNHRARHTLVEARRARGFYLNGEGQWVRAFETRPVGSPERIAATDANEPDLPDTQTVVDELTTSLKPDAFYKYELWGGADIGHDAFTGARAWFFSTELRVVVDGSGIDDRADADFIVKVGADFTSSAVLPDADHPTWRARYIDVATGKLTAIPCDTCYPYAVADGFGGRYRKIPTDGTWATVTAIAMAPTFGGSGLPPPWGNYSQSSSWAQPPFVLTPEQVTSNPPPP